MSDCTDKKAAFLLPLWGMIDRPVWQACDRIMFAAVKARKVPHAWTNARTVCYSTRWSLHYQAMGAVPPTNPNQIDWQAVSDAYDACDMVARFGFDPGVNLTSENYHSKVDGQYRHHRIATLASS